MNMFWLKEWYVSQWICFGIDESISFCYVIMASSMVVFCHQVHTLAMVEFIKGDRGQRHV